MAKQRNPPFQESSPGGFHPLNFRNPWRPECFSICPAQLPRLKAAETMLATNSVSQKSQLNPEVPVERRERMEPSSAVPRRVRAVLSCSRPRRGVQSREQPGQAEGAGICVGDRHPPTSGLISKVMSFWRALFHIVRQGSRLSAPSRAQGLLGHHCRDPPTGRNPWPEHPLARTRLMATQRNWPFQGN